MNTLLDAANAMSPKLTDGFLVSKVMYPKYLFHRTKQENLNKILSSNKLIAGTRSKCEDVRVSMSTKINCDEFGPITLVIDADKLRCDYVIKEFNYDKSMGQYAYEAEWFTDTDVVELSNYIVDITSDYDDSHDKLYQYENINRATQRILALPSIEI